MFFRTEHVVKLIGMVTKSSPVLVLMEFMENGDLENFLRNRRQGITNPLMRFTPDLIFVKYFTQALFLKSRNANKLFL